MGVIGSGRGSGQRNDLQRTWSRRSGLPVVLAVALALLARSKFGASESDAGTALRMDVAEQVAAAELIVEGRVAAARAFEAPGGKIETEFRLLVARTHFGADQSERLIRLPGGLLPDGRGMLIPGLPLPVPGDDVLLMLSGEGPQGGRIPIGLAQGSFRLLRNAQGKRLALRDQGGLQLAHRSRNRLLEADSHSVMDYADLLAQIEAALVLKRHVAERPKENR